MFKLSTPEVTDYADPWRLPFSTRLRRIARGEVRLAYFYAQPDNSTFRYRVYNMLQALESVGDTFAASFFHGEDMPFINDILDNSDVLILCRIRYTQDADRLLAAARKRGIPVFYDVDDLVFDPNLANLLVDSLDQDTTHPEVWDFWFSYLARHGKVLLMCDGSITTNEYLARKLRDFTGKPSVIVPNFLNREQLDISDRIFEEKQMSGFRSDGRCTIGYFSGTPTHNKDLQIATAALERVMDRHSHVTIRLVGYMDPLKQFPRHINRVEMVPFQNFINLQRIIGECEINIAPLQDNAFTNCKSELKFFEAAVVGTVTIATPTFTFADSIEDGITGYLAQPIEWETKLEQVINSYGSLAELSVNARDCCRERYGWFNQAKIIQGAIASLRSP